MKRAKQLRKAFGLVDEGAFAAFPAKFSNVQVARVVFGNARGCSYCFPHGFETDNATILKRRYSWKYYRRTQWRG